MEAVMDFEVVDFFGKNAIVLCPECEKPFIISGAMEGKKGARPCPHCHHAPGILFEQAQEVWLALNSTRIRVEHANRLTFDKRWMGQGTMVQFTESGSTYRYHHDDLLQQLITHTSAIAGTESWESHGRYSFPRLSNAQKRFLDPYRVGSTDGQGSLSSVPSEEETNMRKAKDDYAGEYRIARFPSRKLADHNQRSWEKVVAHIERHGGKSNFDALSVVVKGHESGSPTAPHAYQFITYLIGLGLLEKA